MFTQLQSKKKILVILFVSLACIVLGASWYMEVVEERYIKVTKAQIDTQKEVLTNHIALIQSDKVTEKIGAIIVDCSIENRAKFDQQLGILSQLKGQQLLEIEQLFNMCGDFYALQKAVMVTSLERELEIYENLITLLSVVDSKTNIETFALEEWKTIVAKETKKSELSLALVKIQGDIIEGLKNNLTINSDVMQEMLVEGQKTREELYALSKSETINTDSSVTP